MSRLVSLVVLLVSCLACGALHAGSRSATMTLSCLSLRVRPSTASQLGFDYRLEFSTADDDSINDEMYRSGGTDEVGSYAILHYPGSEALGPLVAVLSLKTPMGGDLDVDGITDFLQVNRAVSNLTTTGTLEVDDGMDVSRGTVSATWKRPAGSASGTVQIKVSLPDFSIRDLVFTHAFEIFQYVGVLTYDVAGTNITATMDLPRVGGGDGFKGPFPMGRIDAATLAWGPAAWQGPGQLGYEALGTWGVEGIESTVNYVGKDLYMGLVVLADGDPSTPFADEYDFFDVVIRDANDTNGNGLPDLSDVPDPVAARPSIRVGMVGGRVRATVSGTSGARYVVERALDVTGGAWTTVAEAVAGQGGGVEVDLGPAAGDAAWFRARIP